MDVTDEQWAVVAGVLPQPPARRGRGRPRQVDLRRVLDALFSMNRYMNRTGCQWRYLPGALPAWGTVRYYFDKWEQDGTWQRVNDRLRQQARIAAGRDPAPSAALIDSQNVTTTEAGGERGSDGGKTIRGRKRQIVVDTFGLLLRVGVHPADLSDQAAAAWWLTLVCAAFPSRRLIWADGGYRGGLGAALGYAGGVTLPIGSKLVGQVGFVVQPRRWVVERTFAWLGRNRRLAKDDEHLTECSETWVYLASIRLLLTRVAA